MKKRKGRTVELTRNKDKNIWITFLGTSVAAVINTIWAAIEFENIRLQKMYCLFDNTNAIIQEKFEAIQNLLELITKTYNADPTQIIPVNIQETDFVNIETQIHNILKELNNEDLIFFDMTPGRKYMSGLMMNKGIRGQQIFPNIHRLYYLHLSDPRYHDTLFPLIPFPQQSLYNLLEPKKVILSRLSEEMGDEVISLESLVPLKINKDQLLVLLNVLWGKNRRKGTLVSRLGEIKLFEFEIQSDSVLISSVITKNEYRGKESEFRKIIGSDGNKHKIRQQFPSYKNFCDLFTLVGFLTDEQEKIIERIFRQARQALKSPQGYFLAFDTNTLLRGVYSLISRNLRGKNEQRWQRNEIPVRVNYFIPLEVEIEVARELNQKLDYKLGRKLSHLFNTTNIGNQQSLKARIFQIGDLELEKMRKHEVAIDGKNLDTDQHADNKILEEVNQFRIDQRTRVNLVSNDDKCLRAAKTRKLDALKWTLRYDFPETFHLSWKQFCDLLYFLSLFYVDIVVDLPKNTDIEINGVWLGKSNAEFEQSRIRLFSNSEPITKLMTRILIPLISEGST